MFFGCSLFETISMGLLLISWSRWENCWLSCCLFEDCADYLRLSELSCSLNSLVSLLISCLDDYLSSLAIGLTLFVCFWTWLWVCAWWICCVYFRLWFWCVCVCVWGLVHLFQVGLDWCWLILPWEVLKDRFALPKVSRDLFRFDALLFEKMWSFWIELLLDWLWLFFLRNEKFWW